MAVVFEKYGYHFTPGMYLIVKVRNRSKIEAPIFNTWEYSEEEYISFINQRDIKRVLLILDDFSMLDQCPNIEMLSLDPSYQAPNNLSYEPVYRMTNLRSLSPTTVYGYNDKYRTIFDCAKLASASKLESFSTNCKYGVLNLDAMTGLKSLSLYRLQTPDLSKVVNSRSLDSLEIGYGNIESLDGIENTNSLQVLSLLNCRKLRNIDALYSAKDSLTGLIIDRCKNIEDYSVLSSLKSLTRLSLIGSGEIPSLSFVEELPNLKKLIIGVNVLDGDLSYCDRLEHTGVVQNRRHYNRKNEDFPKIYWPDGVFGDEGIESWRQTIMR